MIKTLSSKIFTYICLLLVIGVGFFGDVSLQGGLIEMQGVSESYANNLTGSTNGTTADPTGTDSEGKKAINKGIDVLNYILGAFTLIVSPAIMLAGWLMSPDWTSGDLFGIRPVIHDLWIMVSNVTYFIYAILLIFIALATIFNSQNYGYKLLLPKLALGIILVPLTWWFIQFIISLSTVVTASVMNIPMESLSKYTNTKNFTNELSIRKNIDLSEAMASFNNTAGSQDSPCPQGGSDKCISPQQIMDAAGGIYSPLIIYGYSIFRIDDIKRLNSITDFITAPIEILHQLIVGGLMFLVFGLLVLALIFMLLVRAIKLWFYAIFSPLMTLKYVLGDGVFGKENGESFEIKEFIGLAFVPAIVGISLSFGLMIIALLSTATPVNPTLIASTCNETLLRSNDGCQVAGIMGNPNNKIVRMIKPGQNGKPEYSVNEVWVGGMKWVYNGKVTGATDLQGTQAQIAVLSGAGGIFGTIIIDIIALIFIWVAFMAAKGVSKVAATAFEPFEALGKKVGGMAASLPKYTPIPFTGGMSVNSATKAVNMAETMKENADQKRFEKTGLYSKLGGDKMANKGDMKQASEVMNNYKTQAFSSNKNNENEKLGELLRKNVSKEGIEHEKVYTEYMKNLQEISKGSISTMNSIMKAQGFNDEQVKVITGKIASGKYDIESDKELLKAWRDTATTAGKSSNASSSNASGNNFTLEKTDGKPISITITNGSTTNKITVANLKNASLDDLAKNFKGSNVDSNNLKEILQAANNTTNPDDVIKKIKELEAVESNKKS